jgi:hypothetical protein
MLIRFTMPCVLGTTEYASDAEADLPPEVANMALMLGRGVRAMPEPQSAPPQSAPEEPTAATPVPDESAGAEQT